uniref:Glycosyltransferase RgtA/B/C/D-like domain-containing protein n=1 Tax=candidate division WOR-3 bacterium TaxID=2052148 RepID=A0A7C4U7X2_UNCW3
MKDKYFFIIIGIYVFFSIILFDPKQDTGGDNAIYLSLGKSIISLKGYRDIYKPDEPLHTQYPPGYPLLLSTLLLFTKPQNPVPFKFLNTLFGALSLFLFYFLFKKKLKEYLLYGLLMLIAINPVYIEYSHKILSEIPYIFFSFLAIYLFEKFLKKESLLLLIFLSILSTFPYYIRTAGITMIFAIFIALLINRKFKSSILYTIILFFLILPWILRGRMIGNTGGYKEQILSKNIYDLNAGRITFFDFITRILQNLKIYLFEITPRFFLPFLQDLRFNFLFVLIGLLISIIVLIGLFKEFSRKNSLIIFYFILFFSLCLIWPVFWSSDRFLLPLLPLIFYFFMKGIEWINKRLSIKNEIPYYTGLFSLLFISNAIYLLPVSFKNLNMLSNYIKGDKYSGYTSDYIRFYQAAEFAKKYTSKDAKFLVRKPELFYLASERKSFCYPFTNDENKILEAIDKANYIVIDAFYWTGTTRKYLIPVILKYKDRFDVFYKTGVPETYILLKK